MTLRGTDPLASLVRIIKLRRGIDLGPYKERLLERRIAVRLRALGLARLDSYVQHLRTHSEEADELLRVLTVTVTGFFRDAEVFETFERVCAPRLLERARAEGRRPATIWSAGCSTGEEAFSIVLGFARLAGAPPPIRVVGTDLDRGAIERARSGVAPRPRLSGVPPALLTRWFAASGDGGMRLDPALARLCTFRREDLFAQTHDPLYDAIFCRNVMIYFSIDRQRRLVERFARALRPGGYLVLGRVERVPPGSRARFETVSFRDRIYRFEPEEDV